MDDEDTFLRYVIIGYRLTFLVGLSSVAVANYLLPELLQYGKTFVSDNPHRKDAPLWQRLFYATVPKGRFAHFYYLSTFLSMINLYSYYGSPIAWLILFHSVRRAYETTFISKYTPTSRMHWSHYVVGIWFYSVLNLMINIKLHQGAVSSALKPVPFLIFCFASWDQYKSHRILSRLVKYSLPTEGLFQIVCCPHYLDEVLIYASLIPYNWEFSWLLIWVFTNLSVSARENKNYYDHRFPKARVPQYAIIPLVL